ncbi:MAG TPA: hypothetical protein VF915_20045 [Reyranella sp.]
MIFSAGGVDFEIPDEWWAAAGMEAFATSRTGYRRHLPTNPDLMNVILSVKEIGVAPRGHGVPDFERDRMLSVFDAFSRELALPPIEVVEANRKGYRYWLYHGRHRLAASIAVGFSVVPGVIVRSLDEIKRSERITNAADRAKQS